MNLKTSLLLNYTLYKDITQPEVGLKSTLGNRKLTRTPIDINQQMLHTIFLKTESLELYLYSGQTIKIDLNSDWQIEGYDNDGQKIDTIDKHYIQKLKQTP